MRFFSKWQRETIQNIALKLALELETWTVWQAPKVNISTVGCFISCLQSLNNTNCYFEGQQSNIIPAQHGSSSFSFFSIFSRLLECWMVSINILRRKGCWRKLYNCINNEILSTEEAYYAFTIIIKTIYFVQFTFKGSFTTGNWCH